LLDKKEEYKETACQHRINVNKILIEIYRFGTYLVLHQEDYAKAMAALINIYSV
jgi:hypothetical protein